MKCVNNDSGSLKVGVDGVALVEGSKIKLVGEDKVRTVTKLGLGKGEKLHVYCKGSGPFPVGPVEWEVVQ